MEMVGLITKVDYLYFDIQVGQAVGPRLVQVPRQHGNDFFLCFQEVGCVVPRKYPVSLSSVTNSWGETRSSFVLPISLKLSYLKLLAINQICFNVP